MATATAYTDDSNHRAKVTITVTETSTNPGANTSVVTWTAKVEDGNSSFGGYAYSAGDWSVVVNGTTVTSANNQSYDFGSGVISSPYFPRTETGTRTITHNSDGSKTITATIHFNGDITTVGSADASVDLVLTTFTKGKRYDGSSQVSLTTFKRYDGTAWVNLTTKKRYDGTAWVDISN